MKTMKYLLHPKYFLGRLFYRLYKNKKFISSSAYWENHYQSGGNSGAGSYNRLAQFKAEIINKFVEDHSIASVIEFGCGDGNQLKLAKYPKYTGLDVSITTLKNCIETFSDDTSKSFYLYNSKTFVDNQKAFQADLALSLDVIYHLIEDEVFFSYLTHLFDASKKYVIIYSSDKNSEQVFHFKERHFTSWVKENCKNWELVDKIDNKYPFDPNDPNNTSVSDFYIYKRK